MRTSYTGVVGVADMNMATRNASVRGLTPMDVLNLPKKDFGVLAANLPDLRNSFERVAGERAEAQPPVASA